MTVGQKAAIDQLHSMAEESRGTLVIGKWRKPEEGKPLVVPVVLDCSRFVVGDGGLPLRKREKFYFWISPKFPFDYPRVFVDHERFAGQAHVQWKNTLCLYLSPSTDWNPQRGLFGFIERLELFLETRATGNEEIDGAPLHPPVAYTGRDWERILSSANTPVVSKSAWVGAAAMTRSSSGLWDIVGYRPKTVASAGQLNAAVFLLPSRAPFEFPETLQELISHLLGSGIDERTFKRTIGQVAEINGDGTPLYVIVGTPGRTGAQGGIVQSLAIWKICEDEANYIRLLQLPKNPTAKLRELVVKFGDLVWQLVGSKVNWCRVMERRSEVVVRRDADTVGELVRGKRIAIWGAGALGAPIATWVAKMGAGSITIYDNKFVTPGVVIRQPYRQADIGSRKAQTLAAQLGFFNEGLEVTGKFTNIVDLLDTDEWHKDVDLIIDATANLAVLQKCETARMDSSTRNIPIISLGVGPSCQNGIVRVTDIGSREGPWATDRRAKIATANEDRQHFDLLWPGGDDRLFQPEPGCGDPTFRGSASECAAMAGALLNLGLQLLRDLDGSHRSGFAVTGQPGSGFLTHRCRIESPKVAPDSMSLGREIFLSKEAQRVIADEVLKMAAVTPGHETGGIILGEWCHLSNRVYVDKVTGPPPDSICSAEEFRCGIEGVDELSQSAQELTRGAHQLVGIWHSHPRGSSNQSVTDFATMSEAVRQAQPSTRQLLMLIRGKKDKDLAAYGYTREEMADFASGQALVTIVFAGSADRRPRRRRRSVASKVNGRSH